MATKVKRYDPNEYNFGKFAETMNNNYAIERTQNLQGGTPGVNGQPSPSPIGTTPTGAGGLGAVNPVNIGGTTNSQTLGNLNPSGVNLGGAMGQSVGTVHSFGTAERYQGITSGFKSLLGDLDKGKAASLDSAALGEGEKAPATEQQTIGNVASSAVNATATGVNAAVNAVNPQSENVTGAGTSGETGTGTGTSGDPTLPAWLQSAIERFKIEANTQVESGAEKLDFETWQSLYSVDPVKEYQAAQRQLDYEFKTWMSNYGARAEQLYQMGLSNSGVSDIYGANAYTAYIQSSIELKRAQIEQQQENKQLYQQYSDEYEAALAAKTEAASNRISSAFSTFMSSYTPENSESIYNALLGMNMSEGEALQVIQNLDRYYNSIPEDQRASTIQSNTLVTNAYNAYKGTYTPSMKAAVEADLRAQGMDEGQITSVISMLDSFYNSLPEDQRPDVVANGARVDEAFSWMFEQYNNGVTEIETLIAQVKAIYGEDIGAKAAEKFMPFATTEQVDSATIINGAAVRLATTLFTDAETGTSTYTGSEAQKNQIRQLMQLPEYKDLAPYVEEIVAKMDENLSLDNQANIDEFTKELGAVADVTPETIVMDALLGNLTESKRQLAAGKITQEQYDQYASSFSNSAVKAYEWATKSVDNMADAYAMFGFDEAEWAEMDDAQRESAIMDEMAEYKREGLLTTEEYNSVIKNWVEGEIKVAIDTDKENEQATGLREFGAVAATLLEWKNSGALSEKEYLEQLENVISSSGLYVDKKIKWSTVPTADTHIRMKGMDGNVGYVTDENLISILDKNVSANRGSYVAYNDKLYVKRFNQLAGKYIWQPLDIDHYDLPWTGAAFNKTQREGVHELLKILYGVKPPKDTRR